MTIYGTTIACKYSEARHFENLNGCPEREIGRKHGESPGARGSQKANQEDPEDSENPANLNN
jgi:hypothetical protein